IGQDNREWAYEGRGFGTASTAAMLMMENGQNEISIEFGSLNWFDEEIKEEKLRTEFNHKASCKAELYRFEGDNQQVLGTITVTINDKGVPEAKEAEVILNINKESGVIPGYIYDHFYDGYYYPKGMPLYEFKKTVMVAGLPQWVWVKAEEYKDTPEQRAKLQAAYQALWHDFNKKDVKAVKQKMKHSLYA